MTLETSVQLAYLLSAVLFVFGLKRLGSPVTARQGNGLAALAMFIAVVATLSEHGLVNWAGILGGLALGSVLGAAAARWVKMTDMPQLVGLFNGMGGAASALVAAAEFYRVGGASGLGVASGVTVVLGTLIGAVTLSGSMVAFGKLQEILPGRPLTFPLQRTVNAVLFLSLLGMGAALTGAWVPDSTFLVFTGVALLLGILLVIPIGGADMPVVVSLLNSYSGLAASAAGFVLGNMLLIIAGALVGASGLILTQLMCRAMNRSLANVAFGAFGGGTGSGPAVEGDRTVRRADAEQCATVLAYAQRCGHRPGLRAGGGAGHSTRGPGSSWDVGWRARGVKGDLRHPPGGGGAHAGAHECAPGGGGALSPTQALPGTWRMVNPEFEADRMRWVIRGANDVVNPLAPDPDRVSLPGCPSWMWTRPGP